MHRRKITKTSIFILVLTVLYITAYFSLKENSKIKIEQAATSQVTNISKNTYTGKGIQIYFKDNYIYSTSTDGDNFGVIFFGPLRPEEYSKNMHPMYDLAFIDTRTAEDIIKSAETLENGSKNPTLMFNPIIIEKNGFTAVKWAEGGYCENRYIEIIGTKYNYHFSSLGCAKSREYDFNYFEEVLNNTKLINN